MKVRIVWNGQGGELDSVTIDNTNDDDGEIRDALIKLIEDGIVTPGDSFVIEEILK